MTTDPYPDLPGAEPPDALLGPLSAPDDAAPVPREELSDADSRLLAALTRPSAHVVTASEDALAATEQGADAVLPDSARRGPVTPVFQEPTG